MAVTKALRGVAVVVLALASACGGSSGGWFGGTPLTISPTSVSETGETGTPVVVTVTATLASSLADQSVYVGVQDPDGVFASASFAGTSATTATVTLTTWAGLAAGEHVGTVSFFVCRDAYCSELVSERPATLDYHLTLTDPPPPPPPPPAAVLTPAALEVTLEAGDTAQVTVEALLHDDFWSGGFEVMDPQGIFSSGVWMTTTDARHRTLVLTIPSAAAAGTFTGTLSLKVCSSDCAYGYELPGSPIELPYTVTVTPYVPLPAVPSASGLPEWETYQGNAGHTGHVPVTLDAAAFADKWSWTLPAGVTGTLSPVTTGGGRAVVAVSGYFQPAYLFALDEADGSVAWRHDFGSIFAVNHPATAAGRVFVASSGHEDTALWSFDLADGTQVFRTPFNSQWEHYLAPVFKDGHVYTDGGSYGGMYAFKARTGSRRWFAWLGQYELWSPAVDGDRAYAYTGGEFTAVDLATGATAYTVPDPGFNWWGYSLNMAPVLPGDGTAVLVDGVFNFGYGHSDLLIGYDIVAGTQAWSVPGTFVSNPAVAGGTIYVLNEAGRQLEARSAADGALLWSWHPDDPQETVPVGNLVVTQNLVFLGTSAGTYAVDLATHQAVWSTPRRGALALSSELVLYVADPAGTLTAIGLQ